MWIRTREGLGVVERIRERREGCVRSVRTRIGKAKRRASRIYTHVRGRVEVASQTTTEWWIRREGKVGIIAIVSAIVGTVACLGEIERIMEWVYGNGVGKERIRDTILGLGTTLVGAQAITTSLILFTMQVNVERIPHGLFGELSKDRRLLGVSIGGFGIGMLVIIGSMGGEEQGTAMGVVLGIWGTGGYIAGFVYAYKRALKLINPITQLAIMEEKIEQGLKKWRRRADKEEEKIERLAVKEGKDGKEIEEEKNQGRTIFFMKNRGWENVAIRGIGYAVAIAYRSTERGDEEIGGRAVASILNINRTYIEVKGATWYGNNILIENPLMPDRVVTISLEQLRQEVARQGRKHNEGGATRAIWALGELAKAYAQVAYADQYAQRSHAQLAAGYLGNAVEEAVGRGMLDVVMHGQRTMGAVGKFCMMNGIPEIGRVMGEKIGKISRVSSGVQGWWPAAMEGVKELGGITAAGTGPNRRTDIGTQNHTMERLVKEIELTGRTVLQLEDNAFQDMHGTVLGGCFDLTTTNELVAGLIWRVEWLRGQQQKNEETEMVIERLRVWGNSISEAVRVLAGIGVSKGSHITVRIFQWVEWANKVLLAAAEAEVCSKRDEGMIRETALRIVKGIEGLGKNKECATFAAVSNLTETLFSIATESDERGATDNAKVVRKMLAEWGWEAGLYDTGQGTMSRAICGAVTAAHNASTAMENEVKDVLVACQTRTTIMRDHWFERTIREIRGMIDEAKRGGIPHRKIEARMMEGYKDEIEHELEAICTILEKA